MEKLIKNFSESVGKYEKDCYFLKGIFEVDVPKYRKISALSRRKENRRTKKPSNFYFSGKTVEFFRTVRRFPSNYNTLVTPPDFRVVVWNIMGYLFV